MEQKEEDEFGNVLSSYATGAGSVKSPSSNNNRNKNSFLSQLKGGDKNATQDQGPATNKLMTKAEIRNEIIK